MMRLLLLVVLLNSTHAVFADGLDSTLGRSVTTTVKVGALNIRTNDMRATDKADYIYVMADLFPYRTSLPMGGKKPGLRKLATELISNHYGLLYPKASFFKVALVEFPERDEYDAPRWDKIKVLGTFKVWRRGRHWHVTELTSK